MGEHAVKCIAMDSNETMGVTGSADGDIKVWDLTSQRAIQSYPQEHSRHGLFKNISQGVAQVGLDDGTLYSCGADGSMKMRRLPERDVYVNVRDFWVFKAKTVFSRYFLIFTLNPQFPILINYCYL